MRKNFAVIAMVAGIAAVAAVGPVLAGKASLNLVLVIDGLRPDSITAQETPNLWRLRELGVGMEDRVMVLCLDTPEFLGAFWGAIKIGAVPIPVNTLLRTQDYAYFLEDSRAKGEPLAPMRDGDAVTCFNYRADRMRQIVHSLIDTDFKAFDVSRRPRVLVVTMTLYDQTFGVRVAFPDAVNEAILRRFPAAPKKGGAKDAYVEQVNWTEKVLRDYVLPELKPDVIVNWLTEPDHIQHAMGAGSTEARDAIRNNDREIGLVLDRLRELGLAYRQFGERFLEAQAGHLERTRDRGVAQA